MIGEIGKSQRLLVLTAITLAMLIAGTSALRLQAQGSKAQVTLSKKQLKDLITNAREPGDHLKLAAYYRQESQRLRQDAKEHQEWADIYAKGPAGPAAKNPQINGAVHCGNWAKLEAEEAKEAEELATMHENMAKAIEPK
jgi:hypothetical protein